MKRLVLAPHADDEMIGCGGTLAKRVTQGDEVVVGVLTEANNGQSGVRGREATRAAAVLGPDVRVLFGGLNGRPLCVSRQSVDLVAGWLIDLKPDVVYCPHSLEADPDHRSACEILSQAGLHTGHFSLIQYYEVWTPMRTFQIVEDVTEFIGTKRKAIGCYRSQLERWDLADSAVSLARFRGVTTSRGEYCEVFGVESM